MLAVNENIGKLLRISKLFHFILFSTFPLFVSVCQKSNVSKIWGTAARPSPSVSAYLPRSWIVTLHNSQLRKFVKYLKEYFKNKSNYLVHVNMSSKVRRMDVAKSRQYCYTSNLYISGPIKM